ncbi:MAG: SDR family NAD(P)-dependent oxidoreductase [Bacteroidetes bacterium]|nr:SDR family NAD(P)-dependent oxidoreductase [Bacteroidota bacterium]
MNLTNNKILITGGGTGIGKGLAQLFHQLGNSVIICGRRKDVLKQVENELPGVISYSCDLLSENERESLMKKLETEHPDLNVLINNAGIQNWMKPEDSDFFERAKMEIKINVEAPVHLTQLFLAYRKAKTVINVSSGLAFTQLSNVPVYCSTKAFLHSYTRSMRHLLKSGNMEVIEIIPPALNTDLGGIGLHDSAPAVSDFIEAVYQGLNAGKSEITWGFSEMMRNAGPVQLEEAFNRMNP